MAGWAEEFRNPADSCLRSPVPNVLLGPQTQSFSRGYFLSDETLSDPTEPSKFYAFHHWSNCYAYLYHSLSLNLPFFSPTNCCSQNATLTLFNSSFISSTREKSKISEQESTYKRLVMIFNKWPHWVAAWTLPLSSSHVHTWNHKVFIHEITRCSYKKSRSEMWAMSIAQQTKEKDAMRDGSLSTLGQFLD